MSAARAKALRRRSTFAEDTFWKLLRGRGFEGLKFRRQTPLGRYVVDFVCLEHRLILELDGGTHDAPFRDPEQDRLRDDWLRKQGFTVLRFRNEVATSRPNTILEAIRAAADLPSPLAGEGVGGADG